MNKKSTVLVIVVAMLITVSLYFVGGTYARYISEFEGEATVSIAAWKVDGSAIEEVEFTVETNADVATGKIAPATKAVAKAALDLTGTEVAVDVIVDTDAAFKEQLTALGLDESQMTFTVAESADSAIKSVVGGKGTKESPFVVKLTEGAPLSGSLTLDLTIEWEDTGVEWDADDANNQKDTTLGIAAGTESKSLTLPLTVIVQQHIE